MPASVIVVDRAPQSGPSEDVAVRAAVAGGVRGNSTRQSPGQKKDEQDEEKRTEAL